MNLLSTCKCFAPPLHFTDYNKKYWGMDDTNGRFAEITVETCIHCQTIWINYSVEFESFSKSGRWYRGIISAQELSNLTPVKVVAYLEKLDWYIFGGSYFSSTGNYGNGRVLVDS